MLQRMFLSLFLLVSVPGSAPALAADALDFLKADIIAYNLEEQQASLMDGTYRGEEGILCLTPAAAQDLGVKVLMHPSFEEAQTLLQEASTCLAEGRRYLTTQRREEGPDGHARAAARAAALYHQKKFRAWNLLMTYRARLSVENDDRLNKDINAALLDRLMRESLKAANGNLRDALACFYNLCRGLHADDDTPLTPANVPFVNAVFKAFKSKAPVEVQQGLDLDLFKLKGVHPPVDKAMEAAPGFLTPLFELSAKNDACTDPLLFMALIKRESNFNPTAVSYVGAAGLTQIMPATAEALGMAVVFKPEYFDEATDLMREERHLRSQALDILKQITSEEEVASARRARALMQSALDLKEKRTGLFERYQRELMEHANDDRLDPAKAIAHGFLYFCGMLRDFDYDVSLALAAYNAGPHRVRQYGGIPPYAETVTFRNRVLGFYREYLERFRPAE